MTIEGIPGGWELVRIGKPDIGEVVVARDGKPLELFDIEDCGLDCVIIRKIEKPKQYRPFANAAEFEPHRDRWWKKKNDPYHIYPPAYYNDSYSGGIHFERCLVDRTFDDGTPFGVEVTE